MKKLCKRGVPLILAAVLLLGSPGIPAAAAAAARDLGALYAATATTVYTSDDGTYTMEFNNGTITKFTALEGFDGDLVIPEIIDSQAVTAIKEAAFSRAASLRSVHIPESVTSIGKNAFLLCDQLTAVTGGQGVTTLGDSAFENCYALSSVPEFTKLTQMGTDVFEGTALTSFVVPQGLTVIPADTFRDVSELETVTFRGAVTAIQRFAFSSSGLTSIAIPDTVTVLENDVFSNCKSLASVQLPSGLTTMGVKCFSNCRALTEIQVPAGLTTLPQETFSSCVNLTSVTLPDSIETIGLQAFSYCSSLTEIKLPRNLTSLQYQAFMYCTALKEIDLPEGITVIESNTFKGCNALERVSIPSTVTEIQDYAFFQCTALDDVVLPQGLEILGDCAFEQCESVRAITVPAGVREIGRFAFLSCHSLTSVTLPEGLTLLGISMFAQCENLKQITIPSTVTAIPNKTFDKCTALEAVELPESVKSIDYGAFSACSALHSVTIYGMNVEINSGAFNGTPSSLVLYCYPDSTAEQFAKDHGITFAYIGAQTETYTLTAQVLDPEGQEVESGFAVHWYGEDGITAAGNGTTLSGVQTGAVYVCEAVLEDALSGQYETPQRQTVTVGEADQTVTFQLTAREVIPQITVAGQVTDQAGLPLAGAAVTLTNPEGDALTSALTDEDGGFTLTDVPAQTARLRIALEGYYSKNLSLFLKDAAESGSCAVGSVALYETVSDRITLTVTRQYAAAAGETPRTETLAALGGLTVSLSSDDSVIDPAQYEVQGNAVIFRPGAVQANQSITVILSASDGGSAATSVTLDAGRMAGAELTLVEPGGFRLGTTTLPGQSNVLVFDQNGMFRTVYTARTGLESEPMAAGRYTLVFLQNTPMLQNVPDLSMLDQLGLEQGTDYIRTEVTVADGVRTVVDDVTVPALAEDAFSYLESGFLTASTTTPAQGMQVTFTVHATLKEGCPAQSFQIYLPEQMELVSGSVTLDNQATSYTYQDSVLTVSVPDKTTAAVRFSAGAAGMGTGKVTAYARLATGALQPLGAAALTVSPLKLVLPERTFMEEIVATGKAVANSTVLLYDNGMQVAQTTANAAGTWTCTVPLSGPLYDYSYHFIQAEVRQKDMAPVRSEESLVIYDETAPVLTTVTMVNPNHLTGESVTVLDFVNHASAIPSYYYWPGHMDYTFEVKFNQNADTLEEVTVVAVGGNGETVRIPTSYDAERDAWVAAYGGFTEANTPVSLGVEYQGPESAVPFSEARILDSAAEYVESGRPIEDVFSEAVADEESLPFAYTADSDEEGNITLSLTEKEKAGNEAVVTVELAEEADARDRDALLEDGFTPFTATNTLYAKTEITSDAYAVTVTDIFVDTEAQIRITQTSRYNVEAPAETRAGIETPATEFEQQMERIAEASGILGIENLLNGEGGGSLTISSGSWETHNKGTVETKRAEIDRVRDLLEETCEDGTRRVDAAFYQEASAALDKLWQEAGIWTASSMQVFEKMENVQYSTLMLKILVESLGLTTKLDQKENYDKVQGILRRINEYTDLRDQWNYLRIATNKMGNNSGAEWLNNFQWQNDGFQVTYFRYDGNPDNLEGVTDEERDWLYRTLESQGLEACLYVQFSNVNYSGSGSGGGRSRSLDTLEQIEEEIKKHQKDCDEPKPDPDPKPNGNGDSGKEERELRPIFDPSGYVYEAVPSNRLEGVTATVYYQNESGGEVQWDAADYDQINPQITQADGAYAWFVPTGQWKVRFAKDGYLPADSSGVSAAVGNTQNEGWLPVPPPQFEVNVAMVSAAAPDVERVVAYTDRIEVTFSQYMDIESVTDAISLARDGENLSVAVEALDAEYDLEGNHLYATRFAATPADGDCTGTLTISVQAKNYANKAMTEAYTTTLTAPVQRPTAITAGDCSLVLHEEGALSLALVGGAAGTTLTVESLMPSLLTVSGQSVTTGADGTAAVFLTGNLPGVGQIRVTEPLSGLSETFDVTIVMTEADLPEEVKPEPVTAALSDGAAVTTGMTVEQGARITLSTATEGATIRYTLNDTCPCTEEALTYTGPISITEDTVLRAAACKDGVYSDTIRLELTVKTGQPGGGGSSTGGGGGGSVDIGEDDTPLESAPNDIFTEITGHGTIKVTPDHAGTGDTVTITAAPDDGYELHTLTVTGQSGDPVEIRPLGGGTYTFLMPEGKVTVEANFTEAADFPFTDVEPSDYFYGAVAWAVENGVTLGTSETAFSPDVVCTRAQVVTFLWRAAGSPQPRTASHPFCDVKESDYYCQAVLWAVENGITTGTGPDTLSPDAVCTRSQVVTFLYRYGGSPATEKTFFADVPEDTYYYDAVQWAAQSGVTTGTGANAFRPDADCTRAQIVTFLYRALKQ